MWYSFDKVNWNRLTTTYVNIDYQNAPIMYLKGENP